MKRTFIFILFPALLLGSVLLSVIACSTDDDETDNGIIRVDGNGNVNDDHTFVQIDDTTFYVDDIKYSMYQGELIVTGYHKGKFKGDAKIIDALELQGKRLVVTGIGRDAFKDCSVLTSIYIPKSIKCIDRAFQGCERLKAVHITDLSAWCRTIFPISTLTYSDTSDPIIILETGNPLWYAHHLYLNGEEVVDLHIPEDIDTIPQCSFMGCEGIKTVTMSNRVTWIGFCAFHSCKALTSVTGTGVKIIDGYAFFDCCMLTSASLGDQVEVIWEGAFFNCHSLASFTIPNSVNSSYRSVGKWAFRECNGLTSVTFHCKTVKGWFAGLTGIKEVIFGDEVTTVTNGSFYNCSGLTNITIPEGLTDIGLSTFANCSSLTSIVVQEGNPVYDSRDNCNAIIKTETNELLYGCAQTKIPESVTSIGESAFHGCGNLTSITIPNSITAIGNRAFASCTGLTSFDIPESVTSIGDNAFVNCTGLTSISIPEGVTRIGDFIFYGCYALESIFLPSSTSYIGRWAFAECRCIKDVYCFAEKVPDVFDTTFKSTSSVSSATLHVPAASLEAYKAASYWKTFGSIVAIEK